MDSPALAGLESRATNLLRHGLASVDDARAHLDHNLVPPIVFRMTEGPVRSL